MAYEQWDMLTCEHGSIAVVTRADHVVRICFESSADDAISAVRKFHPLAKQASGALVVQGLNQLNEYLIGKRRNFTLPRSNELLTPFAYKVHQVLLEVPYGSLVSYGELALMTGSSRAARAIGGVMRSNPFPLLIPCHRVVNADGRLGQYSAADGPRTKSWLINLERNVSNA